jgi:hypothetical protein
MTEGPRRNKVPPKNKIMMGMSRGAGKRVTRTATKRASKR